MLNKPGGRHKVTCQVLQVNQLPVQLPLQWQMEEHVKTFLLGGSVKHSLCIESKWSVMLLDKQWLCTMLQNTKTHTISRYHITNLCYKILTIPYLSPNSFNKRTDADDNRQDKPGASNSPSTLYGDSYLWFKYSLHH